MKGGMTLGEWHDLGVSVRSGAKEIWHGLSVANQHAGIDIDYKLRVT